MTATERFGEHEFGAQQADAVRTLRRNGFRSLRHGQVDVDLGSGHFGLRFGGCAPVSHRYRGAGLDAA